MPYKINPFTLKPDYYGDGISGGTSGTTIGADTITNIEIDNNTILLENFNVQVFDRFDFNNIIRVDPDASENINGVVYQNLEGAVNYCQSNASITNNFTIILTKNFNLTTPIVITNPYYAIRGLGLFDVTINVTDALAGQTAIKVDYSVAEVNSPLGNFNMLGTNLVETTADSIGISLEGLGVMYLNNLRLQSFDTCLHVENKRVGTHRVFIKGALSVRDGGTYGVNLVKTNINFSDIALVESPINLRVGGEAQALVETGAVSGFLEVGTGIGVQVEDGGILTLNETGILNLAVGAVINGGIINFNGSTFNNNTKDAIINGTPVIKTNGTDINLGTVDFEGLADITGTFFNQQEGDKSFVIYNELSVGFPNQGYETALGEGDSYTTAALYYSYDGSTFTDVKTELRNINDPKYTFPNLNTNTALYFSNVYRKQFYGIKVKLDAIAVLGSGNLVFEYWDGVQWSELNHMITQSSGAYLPFANDKFSTVGVGDFQVRFDYRIQSDWALNDPMSLGTAYYWIRLRISSPITTSPTFDQIKIHTNRFKVNAEGHIELFGNGRPIKKLGVSYGNFIGALNSPSNKDIYLSNTLFAGRVENDFRNNTTSETGYAEITPFDLDTSSPIVVHISFQGDTNTSGNVRFLLKWGSAKVGGSIFEGTNGSETSTNQRSTEKIIAVTGANTYRKINHTTIELEVPEIISQRTSQGMGDLLFIVINRYANNIADTYNGDIVINDVAFYYTSWRLGGNILGEI